MQILWPADCDAIAVVEQYGGAVVISEMCSTALRIKIRQPELVCSSVVHTSTAEVPEGDVIEIEDLRSNLIILMKENPDIYNALGEDMSIILNSAGCDIDKSVHTIKVDGECKSIQCIDGWEGDNCDISTDKGAAIALIKEPTEDSLSAGIIAAITVSSLVLLVFIGIIIYYNCRKPDPVPESVDSESQKNTPNDPDASSDEDDVKRTSTPKKPRNALPYGLDDDKMGCSERKKPVGFPYGSSSDKKLSLEVPTSPVVSSHSAVGMTLPVVVSPTLSHGSLVGFPISPSGPTSPVLSAIVSVDGAMAIVPMSAVSPTLSNGSVCGFPMSPVSGSVNVVGGMTSPLSVESIPFGDPVAERPVSPPVPGIDLSPIIEHDIVYGIPTQQQLEQPSSPISELRSPGSQQRVVQL